MRLDSAGNLGLGIAPTAVSGFGVNRLLEIGGTSVPGIVFRPSGSTSEHTVCGAGDGLILGATGAATASNNAIRFFTSNTNSSNAPTERGRFSSDGTFRVKGAGTAGSTDAFQVAGTAPADAARITSGGDLLVGATTQDFTERLRVHSTAGQGSIVSTAAAAGTTCSVVWHQATTGDNSFVGFFTEAGFTGRGSITYNRTAGLTAYNTTSDYRAKDIIGPVTDSGALIDSTPVYMGKMKDATQERPMFIAHEVPAYAHTGEKDAVDADGKPVYQQMDASALIPVMWAEIQDLRKRLAAAGI